MAGEKLIQAKAGCALRIIPLNGDLDWCQLDRCQDFSPDGNMERSKNEELGNANIIDYIEGIPVYGCKLTQNEYGKMDIYRKMANTTDVDTDIVETDFYSSAFDLVAYLTDVDSTFVGTALLPKQRLAGFSIGIADPKAKIVRSFDTTGEKARSFKDDNKYLVFQKYTAETADIGSWEITVEAPNAIADPNESPAKYFERIVRVRSGVTTELVEGTDCTYSNATKILTVPTSLLGDVIKVWYSAGAYITAETPFTANTSDAGALDAKCCSLYVGTGTYMYRIIALTADVKFNRADEYEIGSEDVVQRSVNETETTLTLGRRLESTFTLEEIFAGVASTFGIIRTEDFESDLKVAIAIYSDKTKATFLMGYLFENLAVSQHKLGTATLGSNVDSGFTLIGDSVLVSTVEANIILS